jgi:hypothetical protein
VKALIVSALLIASCSPVGSGSGATPTASSPPVTSASATPSPTPSPAPGFTRYTNAELGFSVDLPAGWRRATCSQGVVTRSPLVAAETFLNMPEAEESISPGVRMVIVHVAADRGLTPQAWLETNARQPDARIEPATLGERTGARAFIAPTGDPYAYALAARGWIYGIERPFFGSPDQELERILATLRILDDATVGRGPVATPTPRTIESVVDSIADGFAKKDLAAIAETMTPCITSGGIPGDAVMLSRTNYLKTLAAELAAGATVQVRPRPIESDPNFGRLVRSTWSKPGAAQQAVDLTLRADGDRWSVVGVFFRAPGY